LAASSAVPRLASGRPARWLSAAALLAALVGCAAQQREATRDAAEPQLAGGDVSEPITAAHDSARAARAHTAHVIIVSIDGLRPDAIERFGAPTLARLKRQGRYATSASTIVPSLTIPSHASMLTGVEPSAHHATWNDDDDRNDPVAVPTVFSYVKHEGLKTAAFFSKSKFTMLFPKRAFDTSAAPSSAERGWPAELTVTVAAHYLGEASPNLLFVHIADTDYAGHSRGWMSKEYGEAVLNADLALEHLLSRADSTFGSGGYTLIVTADHGGHARTHGTMMSDDVSIPWIVWGEGVAAGAPLQDAVRTMDTAATALWLLGIDVPRAWRGHAVTTAFVQQP
jgi:predicted AlkP superfamily pyrophosphatase or phosphodiesterase